MVVEEVVAEANFSMRAVRTGEAIGHGVWRQYARFSSIVKRAAVAEKSMAQLDLHLDEASNLWVMIPLCHAANFALYRSWRVLGRFLLQRP